MKNERRKQKEATSSGFFFSVLGKTGRFSGIFSIFCFNFVLIYVRFMYYTKIKSPTNRVPFGFVPSNPRTGVLMIWHFSDVTRPSLQTQVCRDGMGWDG
jgi:hypothetical protein